MLDEAEAALGPEAVLLFSTLLFSFAVSVCLLIVWHLLVSPAIPGTRSREDHIFLASSFVSCYPAVTAPCLAVLAMSGVPVMDNELVMDAAPTTAALRAVGISCGYMLYDTCYMLRHRQVRSPLMLMHHLLSILVWPYAVLRRRALLLVLFFIITEVTNIGQHTRMILYKLGLKHTKTYLVVGVSWIGLFFVVRIVPGPYLFYKLCRGNYTAYNTFDSGLMMLTCPLPFMLNSYWFYLLVRGLISHIYENRGKDAGARREGSKGAKAQ
jgi:hypothetical protein